MSQPGVLMGLCLALSGPLGVVHLEALESEKLVGENIVRLEQRKQPSRKGRGALIGFGAGLALTLGKALIQGGCNDGCDESNVLVAALVTLSTTAVGAVVAPGERWEDVAGGAEVPVVPQSPDLTVGSRVRITPPEPSSGPLVGHVVALEPDVVVLRPEDAGPERRVPMTPSTVLEVSLGRKSRAVRGAMTGAAVGAMPGLLMNVGDYNTEKGNPASVSVVGAAAGAALGALIGSALKSEEWRPARMPAFSAFIVPVPRGVAISFSVKWGGG